MNEAELERQQILVYQKAKERFAVFLMLVWKHLGLPIPTPVQIEIADYLQNGGRRILIHAFRGIDKSWITAAYVLWRLWKNPQLKFLIVSASRSKSDSFSIFTKRLIKEMPLLQHLRPSKDQRDSNIEFDVGGATPAQAPSVKSVGITGQMTGARADVVIPDDIESLSNSVTVDQREKLLNLVGEFESILLPNGEIKFLGTPQSIETIYKSLVGKSYVPRYWTSRVPEDKKIGVYSGFLAPSILEKIANGVPAGTPLEPTRFDDEDLQERAIAQGRTMHTLQFMLDTSLSDADRYPLKTSNLIIMPLNKETAPTSLTWGSVKECLIKEIPSIGFSGDRWYAPFFRAERWVEYQGTVMSIDPSGRGADETSYAIVSQLHSNLFLKAIGGFRDGYSTATLEELARLAKDHNVNEIAIESNFGDGMFAKLLTPVLQRLKVEANIVEGRNHTQKELRIIGTLQPLIDSHKLVMDFDLVKKDVETALGLSQLEDEEESTLGLAYSLLYQLTRITRDRGSLKHDDKLDALEIACRYWIDSMAQDDSRQAEELEEIYNAPKNLHS